MNLGIQDADSAFGPTALGRRARGRFPTGTLDDYSAARRPIATRQVVENGTDRLTRLADAAASRSGPVAQCRRRF